MIKTGATSNVTSTIRKRQRQRQRPAGHEDNHNHDRAPPTTSTTAPRSFSVCLLFVVTLLLVASSSGSSPVFSFQLHRQYHQQHSFASHGRRPSWSSSEQQLVGSRSSSSSLTKTQQQTASLHAPPSFTAPSSSIPTARTHNHHQPLLQLLHKELEEFQLFYTGGDETFFEPVGGKSRSHGATNVYRPKPVSNTQPRPRPQQRRSSSSLPLKDQKAEYQRRRDEWARRYTRLDGLRQAFGSNRNKLWGDLDATATRRLYKTLLPNALCELILDLDLTYIQPQELAPLAYQARKAAKLYARERSHLPSRLFATLFDGFRALRRYGRFQPAGMSYDQLWNKYKQLILEDVDDDVTEEEIVSRTCLKIMERSCETNKLVDRMFLTTRHLNHHNEKQRQYRRDAKDRERDLQKVAQTLEGDVRKLLDPVTAAGQSCERGRAEGGGGGGCHRPPMTQQQYHALKHFALTRRRQLEAVAAIAQE